MAPSAIESWACSGFVSAGAEDEDEDSARREERGAVSLGEDVGGVMLVEVVAVGGQGMLLQTRRFCCCARRCSLERWSYELSARDVGPGGMLIALFAGAT